jgi:hypothetical protein
MLLLSWLWLLIYGSLYAHLYSSWGVVPPVVLFCVSFLLIRTRAQTASKQGHLYIVGAVRILSLKNMYTR